LLTTGALLTQVYIFRSHLNVALSNWPTCPRRRKIRPRVAIDADYQYVLRVHRGSESCRKTRRVRVGVVAILQPVRLRRAVRFSHPDLPLGRFMDSARAVALHRNRPFGHFFRRGQPIRLRPA